MFQILNKVNENIVAKHLLLLLDGDRDLLDADRDLDFLLPLDLPESESSFLLLLLLWLLHISLLEVGSVCITLYFPLALLVLLELALVKQVVKNALGLESLLRLGLLKFEFLLELTVLSLQFFCSILLSQFLFLQLSELRSRSSAL